jgi:aldehyde reductase
MAVTPVEVTQSYLLSNGETMPMVGYGTFRSNPGEVGPAVIEAIKAGYRHLDFAHVYGNEKEIGAALKQAFDQGLVTREELFLVSKLWNSDHDVEVVPKAYERSCQDLGVDYLDLYLIHFPVAVKHTGLDNPCCSNAELGDTPLIETWRAMEALVDAKKLKAIGVSNFPLMLLHDFWLQARIKPAVNQIEVHAFYVRESLVKYCLSRNIAVTAHTPLGGGSANATAWGAAAPIDCPEVKTIAERLGKSAGQVLLRWLLQRGIQVIPKSTKADRIAENISLFDFELTEADMTAVSALDRYTSAKTNPNPMSHFIGTKDGFTTTGTDIFD